MSMTGAPWEGPITITVGLANMDGPLLCHAAILSTATSRLPYDLVRHSKSSLYIPPEPHVIEEMEHLDQLPLTELLGRQQQARAVTELLKKGHEPVRGIERKLITTGVSGRSIFLRHC
jgi:hypothetical protein